MYVALCGEEAIVACAHFRECIRDEIGFWKLISVAEDVSKRVRVDGEQARSVEEATVGEGVAVLLYP